MGSSPIISSRIFSFQRELTGGSNSVVESQPSKLLVAGSIPVSRSRHLKLSRLHHVGDSSGSRGNLVEHDLREACIARR